MIIYIYKCIVFGNISHLRNVLILIEYSCLRDTINTSNFCYVYNGGDATCSYASLTLPGVNTKRLSILIVTLLRAIYQGTAGILNATNGHFNIGITAHNGCTVNFILIA